MWKKHLFNQIRRSVIRQRTELFSTTTHDNYKVTVLGASGGIGQPLGLFLKKNPLVSYLALYDIAENTLGVAEDLSHINNVCTVKGFTGEYGLEYALDGTNIVVILAGIPRKPGMSRQDLFQVNAELIVNLTCSIAKYSPNALVAVITNPVNSLVPIVASVMTKYGLCAYKRIFGVTTLDLVRASTFVGKEKSLDPACVHVPVIGGHSGPTIVPLLSQCCPAAVFESDEGEKLTKMIQDAGTQVVIAKAGAGSATLSTAFAASQFVDSLLRGISIFLKVAVIGAAGGIGQPLAMLLKLNSNVTQLMLYDLKKSTAGVAVDISHINTKTEVQGGFHREQLSDTLSDANIVVLVAGFPRKTSSDSRQDLFSVNADIVFNCMQAVVTYCPFAFIAVVTNPINAMLPLVSEFMLQACVYEPKRIFGVTTLDQLRASTFVGRKNLVDPASQYVPVVGGHDGSTIIPLISQSNPPFIHGIDVMKCITEQIQTAGPKVIDKKFGTGSATLAAAYAAERFIDSLIKGLKGERVIECAYVKSNVTDADYFATPLLLGRRGIEQNMGLGKVNDYEKRLIKNAVPILQQNIEDAVKYIEKRKDHIPVICRC